MATDAILSVIQAASLGASPATSFAVAVAEALAVKKVKTDSDESTSSTTSSNYTISDAINSQVGLLNPYDPYNPSLFFSNSAINSYVNPFQYLDQDNEEASTAARSYLTNDTQTEAEQDAVTSARLLELARFFIPTVSAAELNSSSTLFSEDLVTSSGSDDLFSVSFGTSSGLSSTTFGSSSSSLFDVSNASSVNVFSSFGALSSF